MKEKISETFSPQDANRQAEIIEGLIEGLPESEQKDEFLRRCENAEDRELASLLSELKAFCKLRDQAVNSSFVLSAGEEDECFFENNINDEQKQKIKEKIKLVVNEAKENKLRCIGEGKTAKVFVSKFCPEYCYKIISDFNEYRQGNNVKEEAEFLDKLADLEFNGTRAPKPFYYSMGKGAHILIMETIDGASLEDVENKKAKLPDDFNIEVFTQKLTAYIEAMHRRGVHHRDLHSGNVMLAAGGELRIIDFGKSRFSFSDNEELVYTDDNGYNERVKYTPDMEKVKDIKILLTKLIAGE